ncbi:MAG: hypothetical protein WD906_03390 [Anaerolineales bacterium]
MKTSSRATTIQVLEITVACGRCGQPFTYRHDLLGATRSVYGLAPAGDAENQLQKQVTRIRSGSYSDLPPRPCPNCGALQSWMLEASRRGAGERGGCAVALILFVLGVGVHAVPGGPALNALTGLAVLLAALGLGALADRWIRRVWKSAPATPVQDAAPEIRFL